MPTVQDYLRSRRKWCPGGKGLRPLLGTYRRRRSRTLIMHRQKGTRQK